MTNPVDFVEIWRGGLRESVHQGHAVVVDESGEIVEAWGDPHAIVYPRSSAKMVQALPMVESGVARQFGLTPEQLALACASHSAAPKHTSRVQSWIRDLDLGDDAFRCGENWPMDTAAKNSMIKNDETPCRYHNECSGKHCGFLTMTKANGWGPEYVEIDHPLQVAIKQSFEEITGEDSPAWGIDGCSAPNFATSLLGMGRAMAKYACAADDTRGRAMIQLREAMMAHPELVANDDRACTQLMRAAGGKGAFKTGAEGYFVAILPELRLGVALKIVDGAQRARDCAIASILCRLGVLNADDPVVKHYRNPDIRNFAGLITGNIQPAVAIA